MTCKEWVLSFVLSFIASLFAVIVALWIERFRRAGLSLTIGDTNEIPANDPAGRLRAKWLYVSVSNRNVPGLLSWAFTGDHAFSCRAWITFYHLDGTKYFNREMEGRWALTAEPEVTERRVNGGTVYQIRNYREGIDLPPGEKTPVDVVVKFYDEAECYGWNNDSYATAGRNSNWRIPLGRYLVKVIVRSSGIDYGKVFMLINDVPYQDFRLEPLTNAHKEAEKRIMAT